MDDKKLRITMPDGSKWDVPVMLIAIDRAKYYADEYNGNSDRSLMEDTLPLFEDDYEIIDWAANNMDWSNVADQAEMVTPPDCDYQEGWCNGKKEIVKPTV